ncbi:uncharacterized protein sS8_0358 [Methylocaldum marinum]|uniref:Chromosome partition protein Smc n=1 Tax=Methylocaldum marinum TaxID=1432792 RepID=A0A286P3V4_9GAMM|nr:hypothetical protein [Methylocaldum marinum]BBA32326.1 uncharacterized protein sS8_0358 [Methylocaldum marinum]
MCPFGLNSSFSGLRTRSAVFFLSLCCASVFGSSLAHAQAPRQDAAAQALRKAQGMLRQLSQEKAALETERSALLEHVKKLEEQVRRLEGFENLVQQQKRSLDNLRAGNESLQGRIHQDSERIHGLNERLRAAIGELKKYRQDNELLVSAVAERSRWIKECTEKNEGLYRANRELLTKYRGKGFWEALTEGEPFTQISSVRAENEAQAFQFKLEDLQVTPWQEAGENASEPSPAGGSYEVDPDEEEDEQ